MKYVFDIDNTLLYTNGNDYKNSTPIWHRINYVNKLYEEDHHIVLYTARGSRSGVNYESLTKSQVDKYGIKHHELIMGKIDYDYFIDDKAISIKELDIIINTNIKKLNYKNGSDSGYSFDDFKRFDALNGLIYDSVLDVGSGPCMLLKWIKSRNIECRYEAFDVRKEALKECNCAIHDVIPKRKKYDLVCLFGVADYNNEDGSSKKEEFFNLLNLSLKRAKKYLVFSLVKNSFKNSKLVQYSLDEVSCILNNLKIDKYEIDEKTETTEYIIKVNL